MMMDIARFVLRHALLRGRGDPPPPGSPSGEPSRHPGEFLSDNAVVLLSAAGLFWLVRGALCRTAVAVWRFGALAWALWAFHAAAQCASPPGSDDANPSCDDPSSPFSSPPPQWVTHALLCLACVAEATRLIAGPRAGDVHGASLSLPVLRSIDRTLRSVHEQLSTHARHGA